MLIMNGLWHYVCVSLRAVVSVSKRGGVIWLGMSGMSNGDRSSTRLVSMATGCHRRGWGQFIGRCLAHLLPCRQRALLPNAALSIAVIKTHN